MHEIIATATLADAGAVANHYASRQAFNDYQNRKSKNTLRAQASDLATFALYLAASGILPPTADELQNMPEAWQGMTWGLVEGFREWSLKQGFSIATVNRKLKTVKVYAGLATKAGIVAKDENTLIHAVTTYAPKETKRVNQKRTITRKSNKKATNTTLTPAQAAQLKRNQPNTPQGKRDALIMCLLLDHGLRVGELASLKVTDFKGKELVFFREKVQIEQRHTLSKDTLAALKAYQDYAPALGFLLRKSLKSGELGDAGMSERSLWVRVGELGERIGIAHLGPHDCRHYWATRAVKGKTDPFKLMQAGGWTSMQTVQKYIDQSAIANDGVTLSEEE